MWVFDWLNKHATDATESEKDLASAVRFAVTGSILGLGGVLMLAVAASLAEDRAIAFALFAVLLGISGAAAVIGGLLGFLFGIPRTLQGDSGGNGGAGDRVNTNLEQISDWLTKIIVGVGLVQVQEISNQVWEAASYIETNAFPMLTWAAIGVLCVAVYFAVFSFVAGYILTRMRLSLAFIRADKQVSDVASADQMVVRQASAASMEEFRGGKTIDESVLTAARAIVEVPLREIKDAAAAADWARSQRMLGNDEASVAGFQYAVKLGVSDPEVLREYAAALRTVGDSKRSRQVAQEAVDAAVKRKDPRLAVKGKMDIALQSLYDAPPQGYLQARDQLEEIGVLSDASLEARRQYYLACAAGQEATYHRASDAEYEAARDRAAEAIRAVIEADGNSGRWVRMLLWVWDKDSPHFNPRENDLAVFFEKQDPVIDDLMRPLRRFA
ncbi:hypothetical protein EOI86_05935 [Hwanghaeella grinnelliae]|uniref:Tetratricopeptide repeat protein n=1 Tax=Hwanghaeella grinnelliae TaxID=2500179 RepID=A0A3S2VSJ4_9PROT|nr:hypothetical protein [Hwanghaeella grinnelliae]RVU38806.1 hypothetical protein EOI86_05935 [Hwanghaeella grinnelliae]